MTNNEKRLLIVHFVLLVNQNLAEFHLPDMFYLYACLVFTCYISVARSDVEWVACPPDQVSSCVKDCAYNKFPLNRDDASMGEITSFVRRAYYSQPTEYSLWLLQGGPGDSTRSFLPLADYLAIMNPWLTIYLLDVRGTGLSSYIGCQQPPIGSFNPFNNTQLDAILKCNQELIDTYGTKLQYYSTYNSAEDIRDTINLINPKTVAFYALSFGTYAMNTYLQLDDARADCVILDGPVPPDRWPLENNAIWNSLVSYDLLKLCSELSSVCKKYLGTEAHLARLTFDAFIDGTLPCIAKLPWLQTTSAQHFVAIYNNFMTASSNSHLLMAPFWFRMHRCSDSDVEQLNYFNDIKMQSEYYSPNPLDYSYGVAVTIGSSEVYSFAGSRATSYSYQVQETSRLFSDGGAELVVSFARDESQYPLYEVNPQVYRKFAKPTIPVIVLGGTLDPNTENGLGPWFANGLGGNTTFIEVPYAPHGTLSYDSPCVTSIVMQFISSFGKYYDASCLKTIPKPDFDGSEEASQLYAAQYFGTKDLWNNGFETDTEDVIPVDNDDDDCSCQWTEKDVQYLVYVTAIPVAAVLLILIGYVYALRIQLAAYKSRSAADLKINGYMGVRLVDGEESS